MIKKRIAAGLAALLMTFGAAPVPEISQVLPFANPIVVQAASFKAVSADKMMAASVDTAKMTITFTPTMLFFDDVKLSKEIHFDITGYKSEMFSKLQAEMDKSQKEEDHVELNECKIVLAKPSDGSLSSLVNLSQVYFEDGFINEVGASLFSGCKNLQYAVFGDSITSIGNSAFSSCANFVGSNRDNTLQLNNVTAIGSGSFSSCPFIEHINFNGVIKTIGTSAFANCKALKELDFPKTLDIIGANAFTGCAQLARVDFADGTYVDNIGANAFASDVMLKTVDFGSGTIVRSIYSSAFSKDTMLQELIVDGDEEHNTLPNGLEYMGTSVFSGDTALQSFIVPDSLPALPNQTFSGCTALKTVWFGNELGTNSQCELIGAGAFTGCTVLNSIILPNSVTSIGGSAFQNCKSLEKLVVSDSLNYIDGSTSFNDKDEEYKYEHPIDSSTPDPDDTSNGGTFSGCPLIAIYPRADMANAENDWLSYKDKVKLPETVVTVPSQCFMNDTGLTEIYLADVISVGQSAMQGCTSLKFINFPTRVIYMNKSVLQGCTSLKDIKVSPKLGAIMDNACSGCTSLETLTPDDGTSVYDYTLQFPATCGGVQSNAFNGCKSFRYINILTDNKGYTNFGVIGEAAFKGCESIIGSNYNNVANDTVSLPDQLVVVQKSAFENCLNMGHIVLNGDVSTIAESAFAGCAALESIQVSDSVRQVGASAFKNCTSLTEMPRTVDGMPALSNLSVINVSTFENCAALKEAYIPANITMIESSAFKGCSLMESVQWEEGSKLEQIGDSAFSGCIKLMRFSSDYDGNKTNFPNSLITIKKNAFEKCALEDITIVRPAKSGSSNIIEGSAFSNNTSLVRADLSGSNMPSIAQNLFGGCTSLETVLIPDDTITVIDANAFNNCYRLHTFGTVSDPEGVYVIPEKVVTIGSGAFTNNYCMQRISFPSTASVIQLNMFNLTVKEEDIVNNGYTPIEYIEVADANSNYSSKDGVLYNKDGSVLYVYPLMKQDEIFNIPDDVKTINTNAMMSAYYLKGVELNKDLAEIKDKALYNCRLLEFVDFGKNYNVKIGSSAFTATKTATKKVLLYGASPCTAKNYANANSSAVTFVDAAAELNILDKNGRDFDVRRVSTGDKTYQLKISQTNAQGNAADDKLNWSSDNTDVAEVDELGKVTVKNAGNVNITVTNGRGTVSDTVTLSVFEQLKVELDPEEFYYDGEAKIPDVIVSSGSTVLTEGKDYTVTVKDNVKVGNGKVTVVGSENYPETVETVFKINRADINNCDVVLSPESFSYDGTDKEPEVKVYNNGVLLRENTDYTVKFENNVNAGVASVVIAGKNSYGNTKTVDFEIEKTPVSALEVTLNPDSFNYDGNAKEPAVAVTNNGKRLTEGTDYRMTVTDNINAGKGIVTIEGLGGYEGSREIKFDISKTDISKFSASVQYSQVVYDGTEKTPTVKVRSAGGYLTQDKDYTLTFNNNLNYGTAEVIIDGIGGYEGQIIKTFKINKAEISSAKITVDSGRYVYDGTAFEPKVTVAGVKSSDYTVNYYRNVDAGTAIIEIVGENNFGGKVSKTFEIQPADITKHTVELSQNSFEYDGTAKTPTVTIKGLTEGKDFNVNYKNNVQRGTAIVEIEGIKNYTGSMTAEFDITERTMDGCVLTLDADDAEYTGREIKPAVTVMDGDTTLVEGTDYKVTYTGNIEPGTAKVTVEGIGRYSGTLTKEFTIKADDSSKPDDTSSKPDDSSSKPDDTSSKPDDTSSKPDDPSSKPDDTSSKPDDSSEGDTPDQPKDMVKGDVNGDGVVNVTDISKVAAHVKGVKKLSEEMQKLADVNGDGVVNVTDISKIAAHVKGVKKLK